MRVVVVAAAEEDGRSWSVKQLETKCHHHQKFTQQPKSPLCLAATLKPLLHTLTLPTPYRLYATLPLPLFFSYNICLVYPIISELFPAFYKQKICPSNHLSFLALFTLPEHTPATQAEPRSLRCLLAVARPFAHLTSLTSRPFLCRKAPQAIAKPATKQSRAFSSSVPHSLSPRKVPLHSSIAWGLFGYRPRIAWRPFGSHCSSSDAHTNWALLHCGGIKAQLFLPNQDPNGTQQPPDALPYSSLCSCQVLRSHHAAHHYPSTVALCWRNAGKHRLILTSQPA